MTKKENPDQWMRKVTFELSELCKQLNLPELNQKKKEKPMASDEHSRKAARIKATLELHKAKKLSFSELNDVVALIESTDSFSLPRALSSIHEFAEMIESDHPNLAIRIWDHLYRYQYIMPQDAVQVFKRLRAADSLMKIVKGAPAFDSDIMMKDELMSAIQEASDHVTGAEEAVQALWELGERAKLKEIAEDTSISLLLRQKAAKYLTLLG